MATSTIIVLDDSSDDDVGGGRDGRGHGGGNKPVVAPVVVSSSDLENDTDDDQDDTFVPRPSSASRLASATKRRTRTSSMKGRHKARSTTMEVDVDESDAGRGSDEEDLFPSLEEILQPDKAAHATTLACHMEDNGGGGGAGGATAVQGDDMRQTDGSDCGGMAIQGEKSQDGPPSASAQNLVTPAINPTTPVANPPASNSDTTKSPTTSSNFHASTDNTSTTITSAVINQAKEPPNKIDPGMTQPSPAATTTTSSSTTHIAATSEKPWWEMDDSDEELLGMNTRKRRNMAQRQEASKYTSSASPKEASAWKRQASVPTKRRRTLFAKATPRGAAVTEDAALSGHASRASPRTEATVTAPVSDAPTEEGGPSTEAPTESPFMIAKSSKFFSMAKKRPRPMGRTASMTSSMGHAPTDQEKDMGAESMQPLAKPAKQKELQKDVSNGVDLLDEEEDDSWSIESEDEEPEDSKAKKSHVVELLEEEDDVVEMALAASSNQSRMDKIKSRLEKVNRNIQRASPPPPKDTNASTRSKMDVATAMGSTATNLFPKDKGEDMLVQIRPCPSDDDGEEPCIPRYARLDNCRMSTHDTFEEIFRRFQAITNLKDIQYYYNGTQVYRSSSPAYMGIGHASIIIEAHRKWCPRRKKSWFNCKTKYDTVVNDNALSSTAPSGEPEGATAATAIGTVMVKIRDREGRMEHFRIKTTRKVSALMAAYLKKREVPFDEASPGANLRLSFDGERLDPEETLEEIEDGDCLEAVVV